MANQLTSNAEALRLFFTEDIYLTGNEQSTSPLAVSDQLITSEVKIAIPAASQPVALPNEEKLIPVAEKKSWNFEFLGKNQEQILILVNDTANKVSSTQGTELLRKLVKAIGLTNNDFALVNYANYQTATFEELNETFNCKLLLSFGVATATLGLAPLALNQLHQLGQQKMVFTTNLHELDSDQASKKMLWTTLQQIKK